MPTMAIRGEQSANVMNYGAKGDGTADDTAAVAAAIAALRAANNAFGTVYQKLYFPAGRYILNTGMVLPGRMTIVGDGPYQTILYRKTAATGDFITLRGSNSVLRDLTVDGNNNNVTSGDLVVLDAAYVSILNCTLANGAENGVTIGKTSSAIAYRIEGTLVRNCKAYGARIIAGSESTDGMWTNVDVGQSGLSGVRIDNGGQNLVNVHTWGSGIQNADSTDAHGFYVNSSSNTFSNCQAETNRAQGFFVTGASSAANSFSGCVSWGNVQNGWYILNAPRGVMTGCKSYNNGVGNSGGSTSIVYASIRNEGGSRWAFTGNLSYDTGAVVNAGSYSTAPPYPFAGRTAIFTMSAHYTETIGSSGTPEHNSFSGNVFPADQSKSGVALNTLGQKSSWAGNNFGPTYTSPSVAAAAALTVPAQADLVLVTGTAVVTSLTAHRSGKSLVLKFTDAAPGGITDGGNLLLAGNYAPAQNGTILLVCDGTNWTEVTRSGAI